MLPFDEESVGPFPDRLSSRLVPPVEESEERPAVHVGRSLDSGNVEERRSQVDIQHYFVDSRKSIEDKKLSPDEV